MNKNLTGGVGDSETYQGTVRRSVERDANVRRLVHLDLHVSTSRMRCPIDAITDVPVAVEGHLMEMRKRRAAEVSGN